jgi:DNA-binding MarR family transcriptional regulator
MQVVTKDFSTFYNILKTIEKYPGRNAAELSKMLKINSPHLSDYTNTFESFGWITKEKLHQMRIHRITENGKIARVCFEFLITKQIPEGWVFEEELL